MPDIVQTVLHKLVHLTFITILKLGIILPIV